MSNDFTKQLLPEFTRSTKPVAKQSTPSLPPMPTPEEARRREHPPTTAAAGAKHDYGKPDWSLLPLQSVEEVVAVLTVGKILHTPDEWKAQSTDYHFSAAMRHLSADRRGEKKDHETGLQHLAHAVSRLLFMMELQR